MRSFAIVLFLSVFSLLPVLALANTAPVANPGGPYEGTTDTATPILFDGSASLDTDGDVLGYTWDFGDGGTRLGASVFYTYRQPGVFTVSLTVNDGVANDKKTTTATISLKAPKKPNPANGAPFISFPLILDWEDIPGAQSYRYKLIGYEENKEPKEFLVTQSQSDAPSPDVLKFLEPQHPAQWYQDECKKLDGDADNCTDGELRSFVRQQQKRLWQVKSCEDTEGTVCGAWGAVWDFTYLLPPPKILAPTGDNAGLPVRFDWEEVAGAESYLIRGEIDFGTGIWGILKNFFECPTCWFLTLAVNFAMEQLGLNEEAIRCPSALWDENVTDPNEIPCVDILVNKNSETHTLATEHLDTACTFTKKTKYTWYIATCLGPNAQFCGDFSGKKSFTTNDVYNGVAGFVVPAPTLQEPLYDPTKPDEFPTVGFADRLSWDTTGEGGNCAHFHRVTITGLIDGKKIQALDMGSFDLTFPLEQWTDGRKDSPQEKIWRALDTEYIWNVEPCFIRDKENIECEGMISDTWPFRTTGAVPLDLQTKIANPVKLSWGEVKKAGSYKYQVAADDTFSDITKEGILPKQNIILAYPDIQPQTPYWWRVASCADPEGVICGKWSAPQQLTTLPLNPPSAPIQPLHEGQAFLPGSLSWQPDPGASYYQYQASYLALAPDETLEGCEEKVGTQLIQPFPITQQTSFFLDEKCAGEYGWVVRSCADKECVLATDWSQSQLWTFTGKESLIEEQSGLVPCGRNKNDPATPYNEKESCDLRHLGFLLQNLLDFILWKVSLFVLLVLAVITGATSYFSLGGPNSLTRIKTVFRSFLVGFLILMLAWMFVNIVLMLFGFHVEFFGRWWELSF